MRQGNAEIGVEFAGYFPAVWLNGLDRLFRQSVWPLSSVRATPSGHSARHSRSLCSTGVSPRRRSRRPARSIRRTSPPIARQCSTAIQQVEDALVGIRLYSREVKVQAKNVRISTQATQIVLNEYQAGTQAFTAVVVAEEQQLTAEEALLVTQALVQTEVVDLIVALGGGWSQSMLPDVTAETSAIPPH